MSDTADTTSNTPANHTASVEEQLDQILAQAQEALGQLRAELAEQRMLSAQHAEIERLPEYFEEATVKWQGLRTFIQELMAELRSHRHADDAAAATHPENSGS